ncbi:MAG: molybdenum cofactor guanylyltransferase, partial [Planctomycetota bacterium]
PLEGLATALEYLAEAGCERAAVSTCDAPLVQPQLLRWLASQLGTEREAIIPSDGKHLYGLTAAYRTAVWVKLRQLLERGERRIIDLPEHLATEIVTWDACRDVDPQLLSFLNANTPAEYRALCQQATAES